MKLPWKIVVPLICFGALSVAAITWQVRSVRAADRERVEDVAACQAAAERGDPKAEARLGSMYYYGQGVPQDDTKAANWYRKSAEQGNAAGEDGLAWSYYLGRGSPQDYSQALAWFRKAADQGFANAEEGLGHMYYHGYAVPKDYAEASRQYRKAREHGDVRAGYDLGYMYKNGQGLPKDRDEGIRLYRQAAAQGDLYAQQAISMPFTLPKKMFLLITAAGGALLLLGFVRSNRPDKWNGGRGAHDRLAATTGVLCLFTASFIWYGYAHYKFHYPGYGVTAFSLARWLLEALVVALLISIVRSPRKSARKPVPEFLEP